MAHCLRPVKPSTKDKALFYLLELSQVRHKERSLKISTHFLKSSCKPYDTYQTALFQAKVKSLNTSSVFEVWKCLHWFIQRLWVVYAEGPVLQAATQGRLPWQQAFPAQWLSTVKRLQQFPWTVGGDNRKAHIETTNKVSFSIRHMIIPTIMLAALE